MNSNDLKKTLLKYGKRARKIIPFAGIFLFAFILGWITCVSQVYNSFHENKGTGRELYDDNFKINIFPLKISVRYHYYPSVENNDPEHYASNVNIEYNNSPIPLSYNFLSKEKEYIIQPYFVYEYIYGRRDFMKDQIKNIHYEDPE